MFFKPQTTGQVDSSVISEVFGANPKEGSKPQKKGPTIMKYASVFN